MLVCWQNSAIGETFFLKRPLYKIELNARLARYNSVTYKTCLIILLNLLDYHDCLFTKHLVINLNLPIDFQKPFKDELQRIKPNLIELAKSRGCVVTQINHEKLSHRNIYVDLSRLQDVDLIMRSFKEAKDSYHVKTKDWDDKLSEEYANEEAFFLLPGINSKNCILRLFCMLYARNYHGEKPEYTFKNYFFSSLLCIGIDQGKCILDKDFAKFLFNQLPQRTLLKWNKFLKDSSQLTHAILQDALLWFKIQTSGINSNIEDPFRKNIHFPNLTRIDGNTDPSKLLCNMWAKHGNNIDKFIFNDAKLISLDESIKFAASKAFKYKEPFNSAFSLFKHFVNQPHLNRDGSKQIGTKLYQLFEKDMNLLEEDMNKKTTMIR